MTWFLPYAWLYRWNRFLAYSASWLHSKSGDLVFALDFFFFFAIKGQCGWFSPSPDRDPESLTGWRLLVLNAHGKAHHTTVTLCKFALQQLCEQWLCEPSSDSWPWHLVWHVRVLSGPCCPCWVLLPPALASSCRTGCWGHRWISPCLLAPSAVARIQWEMRKASPPSC